MMEKNEVSPMTFPSQREFPGSEARVSELEYQKCLGSAMDSHYPWTKDSNGGQTLAKILRAHFLTKPEALPIKT